MITDVADCLGISYDPSAVQKIDISFDVKSQVKSCDVLPMLCIRDQNGPAIPKPGGSQLCTEGYPCNIITGTVSPERLGFNGSVTVLQVQIYIPEQTSGCASFRITDMQFINTLQMPPDDMPLKRTR